MEKSRFLDLMARIDPAVRRARLEEEKKVLEQRFLEAHREAETQSAFVKRRAVMSFEDAPPAVVAGAAMEQAQAEYQERLRWATVETFAEELEKVLAQLTEMERAGLPKPDDSPTPSP